MLPIIEWAEKFIRIPGGARGDRFRIDIAPWLREPIEAADNPLVRQVDLIKPVQSGGSLLGEIFICRNIVTGAGRMQYNWEDGEKAKDRWTERIYPMFRNTAPVWNLWPLNDRTKSNRQFVAFPAGVFQMQGVIGEGNLDSAAVKIQINEEIHNWPAGHLAMAADRLTAFWDSKQINISNAGKKGDQLYQAHRAGTDRILRVKCPGCGQYHEMHTRWDKRHPHLGGLRYNSDGCKRADGTYDYNRLESTIRYEFPCRYELRDDVTERRRVAQTCKYSEPRNTGAHLSHESFTYDAVVIDYIPWLKLIEEKHQALRAKQYGDLEPWRRYVTHRECNYYDPDEIPFSGKIVLSSARNKDRAGMANRELRCAMLDRQQGRRADNEWPHWWLVIVDFDAEANALLVWEGKCQSDEVALDVIKRHEVDPKCVCADSGDDTTYVYTFCLAHGFNAIKGDGEKDFAHPSPDGKGSVRRVFSVEKPLHAMINAPPIYDYVLLPDGTEMPDDKEPLFWLYSKSGIRERFAWLRANRNVEFPGDVSEDFQQHMESEEYRERKHPRTGETIGEWVQLRTRNDLYVCMCYACGMFADMAGLIGPKRV